LSYGLLSRLSLLLLTLTVRGKKFLQKLWVKVDKLGHSPTSIPPVDLDDAGQEELFLALSRGLPEVRLQ
jgi:hypothetical protein